MNTATLGGNLVATPKLRHTPNDDAVTDFTPALNEKFTNHKAEMERTSFIEITAWKELAVKIPAQRHAPDRDGRTGVQFINGQGREQAFFPEVRSRADLRGAAASG